MTEEIERALLQALTCREDRRRAQATLEILRQKEEEAAERLHTLVCERETRTVP